MNVDLKAQELHFLKTAIESSQIVGKDALFTAEILIKLAKALQAAAEQEGLVQPAQKDGGPPPSGTINNPKGPNAPLPAGAPPIPESKPKAAIEEPPQGSNV